MKKQSGFTLIELLLVLAIIGIISAIAIPALLGQRARARDKSAISNMEGRVGDLVGQYDKYREIGLSAGAIKSSLGNYLNNTGGKEKNPWYPTATASIAFNTVVASLTGTSQAAIISNLKGKATSATKGQVQFGIIPPTTGVPGFIGGAVFIDGKMNNSNVVYKVTAIE